MSRQIPSWHPLADEMDAWKGGKYRKSARDRSVGAGQSVRLGAPDGPSLDLFRMDDSRFLVGLFHQASLTSSKGTAVPLVAGLSVRARVAGMVRRGGPFGRDRCRTSFLTRRAATPGKSTELAGQGRAATLSVVHLRARDRAGLDLLGVLDGWLLIRLFHVIPQLWEPSLPDP